MPPTAVDTVRVAFRGSLMDAAAGGSVTEEFSMSMGFSIEHNNAIEDWQAVCTEIATDLRDSFTERWESPVGGNSQAIELTFPGTVRWDQVRAYHLGVTGLTEHLGVAAFGDMRGSSGAVSLPPQNSVCVSLYAYDASEFNTHGRRGRGRFYLPPIAATLDVGGLLSTAVRDRLANWIGDVLNDFENKFISEGIVGDGFLHLVIIGNDGVNQQVKRARIGRVIDTQRRRRNNLDEAYVDRAIELE